MNEKRLLTPLDAAASEGDDFYASYPLREWTLLKKMKEMTTSKICGDLCSTRITWQRTKKLASTEEIFLFQTLPWLLDAAWLLSESPLKQVHIEQVPGKNNLFALASFENGTVSEIEMNECLPDSMPSTYFIKANFTNGHLTNQPLVGHFNEEGSILADDESCKKLIVENPDWQPFEDQINICVESMNYQIKEGKYPAGPLNSKTIIEKIREALS